MLIKDFTVKNQKKSLNTSLVKAAIIFATQIFATWSIYRFRPPLNVQLIMYTYIKLLFQCKIYVNIFQIMHCKMCIELGLGNLVNRSMSRIFRSL